MYYPVRLEEDAIVRNLLAGEKQDARMEVPKYHQMSLFDDTTYYRLRITAKYEVTYTLSGTYYRSTKQRIIYRTFLSKSSKFPASIAKSNKQCVDWWYQEDG